MGMDRGQFTFYASFFRAIQRIRKAADRAAAYDAICAYALSGVEPDMEKLPDSCAIVFDLIRPNLDASFRMASGGKRKCKPKVTERLEEGKPKVTERLEEGCGNKKEKEGEKEKEKEGEKEKEVEVEDECPLPPKAPPRGRTPPVFHPPTAEEVAAYCLERGNGVDALKFHDFYASKGWMVGKNPMKDWRAAVRTWERSGEKRSGPSCRGGNPFLDMLREDGEL